MKIHLIILILTHFCFQRIYSQETIPVTKDRDNSYEEYSVLATDKKIKHGSYFKLNKPLLGGYAIESIGYYLNGEKNGYWESYYGNSNNIRSKGFYRGDLMDSIWIFFYPEGKVKKLVEVQSDNGTSLQIVDANPVVSKAGSYKNGKLIGIWEYFGASGEINQKFDHDNQLLTYLKGQDTKNCEAGFIGGEFLMYQHLYDFFDFNELMKSVNNKFSVKTGKITFSFTIDENGSIQNITESLNTIGNKKVYTKAIETIQSLSKQWYPKKMDDNLMSSQKTITFEVKVETKNSMYMSPDGQSTSSRLSMGFELKILVD